MKTGFSVVIVFLFLSAFPWQIQGSSTGDSACVKCHTDTATMKTLVKVPVAPGGEGEG